MLVGLLPNKWVLLAMAALIVACGYLYLSRQIAQCDLQTTQVELEQAKRDIDIQKDTIDNLQRDAKVQSRLMRTAQEALAAIRMQAQQDASVYVDRDIAQEANDNVEVLQDEINKRMQKIFADIATISNERSQ